MTESSRGPVRGRSSLLASLDAGLDQAKPDFEAVLGRVEAGEGADVLEEHVDVGEPPREIAEACEALRARLAAQLGARLIHEPVPPSVLDDPAPRRMGVWAVVGVLAAAALLFLILDPPSVFRGSKLEEDSGSNLAVDEARPEEESGQARFEDPPRARPKSAAPRRVADVTEPPVEPEPVAPDPEVASEPAPAPAPTVSLSDRLATLDARAQKKWAAGDLDGARRDFRKIVKLGGKRKRVELAYAELFALARQRGEDLSGLWREYLRKFPKGRYAREASAGLCRGAAAPRRETCWEAHRDRFGAAPGGGTG